MPNHPVDIHVGERIRQRRALLGMSQTALGEAVGLTFQQIQKYERGANRTASSRLYEFANVLSVPIAYFFEGLGEAGARAKGKATKNAKAGGEHINTKRETLELVRAYYKIRNDDVRNEVRHMILAIGGGARTGTK